MRGRARSILVSTALAASAFGLTGGATAHAGPQLMLVNSTADLTDTSTGDGSCHASNGKCTLRAAIQEADKLGGAWLIVVPAGTFSLTRTPRDEDHAKGGDLDVKFRGTIRGAGATKTIVRIDRTKVKDRVFDFLGSGHLTLAGMTIANGDVTDAAVNLEAGGIITDDSSGTLILLHDVVRGNRASNSGGAISAAGDLVVTGTTISGNTSGNNGGAIRSYGDLTVVASTLSGNQAPDGGGGAIDANGHVTVRNSTITGNVGGAAGAIIDFDFAPTIVSSTIAGNSGSTGNVGGDATLTNSILANGGSGGDCSGTIQANHSLIDDTTGCTVTGSGNVLGQPAKLGALKDNGGPTATMALLPGSPARDAGDGATCPATDQRGVHRPQGPGCDIGAYEVPHPVVTKPTGSTIHQATLQVAWRIPGGGGGAGAKAFDVRYRDRQSGHPFGSFHSLLDHATARHTSFTAMFGFEYCFSARAIDAGGNGSPFGNERCVNVSH
jgi:CSLREA domain-containing protein